MERHEIPVLVELHTQQGFSTVDNVVEEFR